MTKAPTPTETSKGQSDNTNNATKKFDQTAVADRLRTVSRSNYSHPTGVVNRFTGPPSHQPQQPFNQKDKRLKIRKQTSLYRQQTNSHPKRRGHKNRYTQGTDDKYNIAKIYMVTSE